MQNLHDIDVGRKKSQPPTPPELILSRPTADAGSRDNYWIFRLFTVCRCGEWKTRTQQNRGLEAHMQNLQAIIGDRKKSQA
jgi:hypothetical protein